MQAPTRDQLAHDVDFLAKRTGLPVRTCQRELEAEEYDVYEALINLRYLLDHVSPARSEKCA